MAESISIKELREKLKFNEKTGQLIWAKASGRMAAGSVAGHAHKGGYWRLLINGEKYPAHRVGWAIFYGEWPTHQLDHIDGNKANNAISNLRLATPSMNQLYNNNARKNNSIGFLGVRVMGRKFGAQVKVNSKINYLGLFDTPQDAHSAYLAAKSAAINTAIEAHIKGDV
jgi:hypothetical protein